MWSRVRRSLALVLIAALWFTAVPVRATSNSHVLITALYYDTALSGEPDEAIRLHNPTATAVDLSGWSICNDNGTCAILPAGASLGTGSSIWVAREADDFAAQWTFTPSYEMVESDGSVANTSGSAPVFANSGEAVYLKNGAGAIIDMVVYGSGVAAAGDPWSGTTVATVSAGQLLHRAYDEAVMAASGALQYPLDTDSAADWKQGSEWRTAREFRRGQVFLSQPVWSVTGSLTAYTTPDSSYGVLAGLIDGATNSIDMQIYEFQSYALYQKLSNALARGVAVRLYLEGNPVAGMADQAKWVAKELTNQGAQVMLITSSTGYQRYNFTHSKFGIIDGAKVFAQSENAKQNGTPSDPSYGNRGWGVVVQSADVVAFFQDVFGKDWNPASPDTYLCLAVVSDLCSPPSGFTPDQTIPTGTYPHPYNSYTFNETYQITPVMSPDHSLLKSSGLRQAFASATKEILAEHMYLYKYWGASTCNETDCPNLWLQDLIDAARRGVRVRVVLGAAFLDPTNPRDNQYTAQMLNGIAAAEGLDMEARIENLAVSGLEKIHNKGFIIDGQKVLISSINGSENSATENREAALLIDNANVAQFYRDVWYWNWNKGKDGSLTEQPLRDLMIAEVMYDPPGTESEQEWLELYNPTASPVDLTGWKLHDNGGNWSFPAGSSLAAGDTLTVARSSTGFQALYSKSPDLAGLTLSLANTADYLLLVNPQGNVVSKVGWGNAKPNWGLATAQNTTLERCPIDQDRFSSLDWTSGAAATPDYVPTACGGNGPGSGGDPGGGGGSTTSHLLLSEVFYDTPGDDTKEEYVELYNGTGAAIDLTGWQLSDNNATWTFPSGTSIAHDQYLVAARDSAGFQALFGTAPQVSGLTLALGNSGDQVRLLNPSSAEVDMVAWESFVSGWTVSASTGNAIHRSPVTTDTDLTADWASGAPTPAAGP